MRQKRLLCETRTSSETVKTPDVTKLSWKPRCPRKEEDTALIQHTLQYRSQLGNTCVTLSCSNTRVNSSAITNPAETVVLD